MSNNVQQILAMGGYGMYVWSAYAITLVVLGVNLVASFKEQRRVKKTIKRYLANAGQSL